MKSKAREIAALEADLEKLTNLVRERRRELARIQECPNKSCRCRVVWKEQVDKNLERQVRNIRRHIASKPDGRTKATKAKS